MLGFTLMELLSSTAILGVVISIVAPFIIEYSVQTRVEQGIDVLEELGQRVEDEFNETGILGTQLPSSSAPTGQVFGGFYYSYETLFGAQHEMWESIEYQPKGPHRVIALRAYRLPEWKNSDIGIHLQIKLRADNTLEIRCAVNNHLTRLSYIPSSCRDGDVNDWTSW